MAETYFTNLFKSSSSIIRQRSLPFQARTTTLSSPFEFTPSQLWEGNDGSWSTFYIRVGTPDQIFRILPATNGQETWVPVPEGRIPSDSSDCGNLRGVEFFKGAPSSGFQINQSSTWRSNGIYNLFSEANLNYSGNGQYGFDTVGLGIEDVGGLSLADQVVAGFATKDFFLGVFGLGPKPANFTNFTDPKPSYMRNLVDKKLIPSLSFGYTAGAPYRLKKVLGSLTLGGYDSSRFISNNISFYFASDDSRSLTVGLQSIAVSSTLQGEVAPLTSAFGLEYDVKTELYLVNDTIHAKLQQLNPTVTFKIGNTISGGEFVNIELPYLAFDLQASSPIYPNAKNYFPIRRADNDTQYTLGRTFLQEAYIIVDYERSNFSVSQALFKDPNPKQIVTIDSVSSAETPKPASSQPSFRVVSRGAIAGIALGAAAALLVTCLFVISLYRKHIFRQSTERRNDSVILKAETAEYRKPELPSDGKSSKFELATNERNGIVELDSRGQVWNFPGGHNSTGELDPNIPAFQSRALELQAPGSGSGQHIAHELSNAELRRILPEARGGH
ncbi:hypothetical protein MMC22_004406 [Lobaria immixta]|nr:hypothetical protein [Lobaria immixta]